MRNVPAFPQSGERGRILIAAQKHTGFADFAAQTAADAKQIVRGLLSNAGVQAIFVTQARMLEKRDAANAIAFSSVWIDLDGKKLRQPGDNDNAAKERVFTTLDQFFTASGLPRPSVVVDSGGGAHCYWVFERQIEQQLWHRIARALHACMRSHGLPADVALTINSACILRVPGTYNRKPEYGTARLVRMIHPESGDPVRYDPKTIEDALAAHMKPNVTDSGAVGEGAAEPKASNWVNRLKSELQDEVLDYALGIIATKTKYLERCQRHVLQAHAVVRTQWRAGSGGVVGQIRLASQGRRRGGQTQG